LLATQALTLDPPARRGNAGEAAEIGCAAVVQTELEYSDANGEI